MSAIPLLAISGSLRAGSSNGHLLRAAARLVPAGVEVAFYDGLASLPHFNPDDDSGPEPPALQAWRAALASARGVLISSPEYAHGIPGSLKNALDWVVGSGEFMGKPVALLNAAPTASHAQAQLREVLTTMDALVIDEASIAVPVSRTKLDADAIVADPALAGAVAAAVAALVRAIEAAA